MIERYFFDAINQVDIVSAAKSAINNTRSLYFFEKSGLSIINQLVRNYLGNCMHNTFVEYSFISSTLDKNMPGLSCFSLITDKSKSGMLQNIQTYCSPIIKEITEKDGYSIYHHPDLFMAPLRSDACGLVNISYSDELCNILDYRIEKDTKTVYWQVPESDCYVQNMSFKRSYQQMLDNSRSINSGNVNISVNKAHKTLHSLYHTYFIENTEKENVVSCYISIPIIGSNSSNILSRNIIRNNSKQGQGAIFLFFTLSDASVEKMEQTKVYIRSKIEELFVAVNNITHCYSVNYLFNLGLQLQNDAQNEAIKSAKAAIMSRNMSHNLGSHYIANTKNYISDLANAKNDKDLRGLTHLLQYIQERMDYIATVISNDVYPLGALNIKSQIFDELTIDDCGERHGEKYLTTNFLLKYIVFSEKYSRVSTNNSGLKNLRIEINYPKPAPNDSRKKKDRVFTGKGSCKEIEDTLKLELSKLNIAVPCGIMARHALFNIIENIIRNSAKHNKENCDSELVIRLTLEKDSVNPKFLKISIHDNRGGYDSLIGEHKDGVVAGRLKELRFLKADGSLDKNNKGLKEMIISALWLKNKDVGGVMTQIDNAADGEEKYKIITQECLRIERSTNGHLAYVLDLPIYQEVTSIDGYFSNHKTLLTELNSIYADVVIGSTEKSNELEKSFDDIFPRYLVADDKVNAMSPVEKLKNAICRNLNIGIDDFEKYTIHIDKAAATDVYKDIKGVVNTMPETPTDKQICFITHFDIQNDSQKKKTLEKYKRVAYLDSISGENFTSTLVSPDFLNDEYLKCKIIESALTKIAIIDERIYEKFAKNEKAEKYSNRTAIEAAIISRKIETISKLLNYITNKYHSDYFADEKMVIEQLCSEDTPLKERLEETDVNSALNILCPVGLQQNVLDKRSIYVYTIEATEENSNVIKDVSGGSTKLGSDISLQKVHFLSIHLGLVEKCKNKGGVKGLMEEIRVHFPDVRYIAIHSGRGNYSADLSSDLKDYCFITLSALEAAINNSKYMLSQLFYNMNYYGKGNINND